MATMRQAQTGNRVYRGVGTSPNMGPVSAKGAQGYLQRELRKPAAATARPVGSDGKSDSRSGVAARALNNTIGGRPQAGKLNQPKGPQGVNSGLGQKGQHQQPVGAAPAQQAPVVPQIKVNANGQLELPYSQNLSLAAMQALQGSNDDLMALQQEEQELQQMVQQGRRDAETQYGQLKEQTLSGNASNGTAFSSMYAKGVADNATAYSNTLADLSRQETDGQQQFAARRAAIQNSLAQTLAQQAQEEADALNEDAGSLGYGTYQGEDHSHDKNKPKPKPKPNQNKGNNNGAKGGPVKGKGKK